MSYKKVNIEELTRKLNEFRMSSLNKTFTGEELNSKLMELGFTTILASKIANKHFPFERIGKGRLYGVPKDPIHKSFIQGLYRSSRESSSRSYYKKLNDTIDSNNEEAALALLASKGYQIRKCVGFDLERFQKENPVLYRKYLKYEIV